MVDRRHLTYDDIDTAVDRLVSYWAHAGQWTGVYGVPRGGCVPAAMVACELGGIPVVDDWSDGHTLIVDDLADSGATAARYPAHRFAALYHKRWTPPEARPAGAEDAGEDWLVFPWETVVSGPEDAVVRLLTFIGEDPARQGLVDTPSRVVKAWAEMTAGYKLDPGVILERCFDEQYDEMVVLRDLAFTSMCEHHMLPFTGTATIGYVPVKRVVGISKLARLLDCYAQRLQVQERMTKQIADALVEHLHPLGVGVVIKARHQCMACRGVRKAGEMVTSAVAGCIKDDPMARSEFLALT